MKRQVLLAMLFFLFAGTASAGDAKTTHFYPHIADLDAVIRTVFLVLNQGEEEVNITLEFFASDGTPLTLTVDGTTATSIQRAVPARSALRLPSSMTSSPIAIGWARLTADRPVGSQALFEIVSGGNLVTQAAIDSATLSRRVEGFVEVVENVTSTGFGIANPTSGAINVQVTVRQGANVLGTTSFVMAPGTHMASFINQTFQNIGNVPSASVEFFSTGQFALVVLQQTGLILGSLPSVPNESF